MSISVQSGGCWYGVDGTGEDVPASRPGCPVRVSSVHVGVGGIQGRQYGCGSRDVMQQKVEACRPAHQDRKKLLRACIAIRSESYHCAG